MESAQLVRLARQKLGMIQEDLASTLHISFTTIDQSENTKTHPNQLRETAFFDFCKQYGVKLEILNNTEE